MDREIVVIAHNIRSAHNIGSLFRSCDGLGVKKIYLTGYSPYPKQPNDTRLPHVAERAERQIHKTALGAEKSVDFEANGDLGNILDQLKADSFELVALEQAKNSISLPDYTPKNKIALLLGEEVKGIESELLKKCDKTVEIPMKGKKESFNVSIAAVIALYHLRFTGI